MHIIAVIPARYGSSRLPGKPLSLLKSKSLIEHVYQKVNSIDFFEKVIVATDDERIYDHVIKFGGNCQMTSANHKSGTDRIAEVCSTVDFDIVVNIQGDEPFISCKPLQQLVSAFKKNDVQIASLMHKVSFDHFDPNKVKVVVDKFGFALYFSRSEIPYFRDHGNKYFYQHIGVYAFRRASLFKFVHLPVSFLENTEKLEQLRLLENGLRIMMIETEYSGFGIDTPDDLARAREFL